MQFLTLHLPGIALAFLMTQTKRTEVLLIGALISGLLSTFIILSIVKYSRIKFDSALCIDIIGILWRRNCSLLTYIQKIPNANQAGLEKFILGRHLLCIKERYTNNGNIGSRF